EETVQQRNGRERNGQFAKGNSIGPGNPYARAVARLRHAALAAVKPEDLYEIFQTLVIHAKAGRVPAIKILLAYTLGKPAPAQDPDAVAQQQPEQAREEAQHAERTRGKKERRTGQAGSLGLWAGVGAGATDDDAGSGVTWPGVTWAELKEALRTA